mmetsp:Transcript_9113/g.22949  ORF Transcript_9113/g.22949 Transcript_9113/m.22949 type:complete len:250 (+) Transcript_9113:299-1048(+)
MELVRRRQVVSQLRDDVRRGGVQPPRDLLYVGACGGLVQGVDGAGGERERGLQKLHVCALPARPKRRIHQHRLRAQPPLRADVPHVAADKVDREVVLPLRRVPLRHRQRVRVDVHRHHVPRAHDRRPDAQHPRAAAEVQHGAALQLPKAVLHREQELRGQVRGGGVLLQLDLRLLKRLDVLQERLELPQLHAARRRPAIRAARSDEARVLRALGVPAAGPLALSGSGACHWWTVLYILRHRCVGVPCGR